LVWFVEYKNAKDRFTDSYGLDIKNQNILLNKITQYNIKNIRVHRSKSLMPFQKGILTSNKSFENLLNDLQKEYRYLNSNNTYLILGKMRFIYQNI